MLCLRCSELQQRQCLARTLIQDGIVEKEAHGNGAQLTVKALSRLCRQNLGEWITAEGADLVMRSGGWERSDRVKGDGSTCGWQLRVEGFQAPEQLGADSTRQVLENVPALLGKSLAKHSFYPVAVVTPYCWLGLFIIHSWHCRGERRACQGLFLLGPRSDASCGPYKRSTRISPGKACSVSLRL
jgi:hypothetical protein